MAEPKIKKLPYPPTPKDVPDDLTDYPATYRAQQNTLLAGLFLFLLSYLGLICLCVLVAVYCFMSWSHLLPLKLAGLILSGTFFLFLVKGFFKRTPIEKELHIEVTEDEQPILFEFIRKLITELDAPEPNRVFVSLDVNAAVMPRTSLVNLFKEPKKDLLIGLGLVNMLNLSEFKSVMAHEFGHFCQSAYASSYTYVAHRIIADLVDGEDWFDRLIEWSKRQQNAVAAFGHVMGALLWVGRKILMVMFKAIILQRMAVSREQEFHADLCAVKAAGSDAVGLSLLRLRFGNMCFGQALTDLRTAAEHKLYTNDLFYHQEKAATVVRRLKKDPQLGERPDHDGPLAGKELRVFDPDTESLEDDEVPEMRRSHPSFPESEENAKATFIPGPIDIRSPWVLFTNAAELKERLTYKFYRMSLKIKKDTELEDAEKVQEFIDNEHAETTYDPKYGGLYDDRPLEPGEIADLNQILRDSPWADDRIDKVYEKLYEGSKGKAEEYEDLRKERATLENNTSERGGRVKKLIADVDKKLDKVWEWFKSLDRRVYLVHVQMADRTNKEWKEELVERYRFQTEVQKMYQEARYHQSKALAFANALFSTSEPHPDFFAEVMQVLRQAWKALKNIVRDAREINLPAMKNFEEGESLVDYIMPGKLVSELPLTYVKGKWINKLLEQLDQVRGRCFRLHWKSVGGILALQEKIAAEWVKNRAPVEAAVVEDGVEAAIVEAVEALPADGSGDQICQHDRFKVGVVREIQTPNAQGEIVVAEVVEAVAIDAEAVVGSEIVEAAVLEEAIVVPPVVVVPVPPVKAPTPPPVPVPPPRIETPVPIPSPPPPVVVVPVPPPPPPVVAPDPEPVVIAFTQLETQPETEPEPEPKLPADAIAEMFAIDTATTSMKVEDAVGEIFSLDPDAGQAEPTSPPPPVTTPSPPPAPIHHGSADFFSLDLDDQKPSIPAMGARMSQPAPTKAALVVTSTFPEDAGEPTTVTKPAKNGRPEIKITMLRPGQKSPLSA